MKIYIQAVASVKKIKWCLWDLVQFSFILFKFITCLIVRGVGGKKKKKAFKIEKKKFDFFNTLLILRRALLKSWSGLQMHHYPYNKCNKIVNHTQLNHNNMVKIDFFFFSGKGQGELEILRWFKAKKITLFKCSKWCINVCATIDNSTYVWFFWRMGKPTNPSSFSGKILDISVPKSWKANLKHIFSLFKCYFSNKIKWQFKL